MAQNGDLDYSGGATENVQVEAVDPAHPYLELQVVSSGQQEFRLPFLYPEIELAKVAADAFSDGTSWIAKLKGEDVELVNTDDGTIVPLIVGDHFEVDGARIRLRDVRRPPLGTLSGVSDAFSGRSWSLSNQQTWVGRKGKRLNHIELNHQTISRTHATFLPDRHGHIELLAESGATTVNGKEVENGKTTRLTHGSLIGLGKMMFRFTTALDSEAASNPLTMNSLGTFQVKIGSDNKAAEIKNEKAQFLLAALAVSWGEPRSIDWVLAQFWPEVTASRGRKNLSYTVVQLRDILDGKDSKESPLFLRTPSTIQLNPERLGAHDYNEVKRLVSERKPVTSQVALERLISLYRGHFMPNCYDEWAEVVRQTLDVDFGKTLIRSAEYYLEKKDFTGVKIAAEKLLSLDPLNEEAARLYMLGALEAAQPTIAVEIYKKVEASLKSEGLEPDTELMKIYYKADMGL